MNSYPKGGQIRGVPIIPAVHRPAYSAAVRTAAAATQAMGRNVKTGWTVGCDLFDATAWNETESVHPLFNGEARASSQTSVLVRHDPRKVRENHPQGRTPSRLRLVRALAVETHEECWKVRAISTWRICASTRSNRCGPRHEPGSALFEGGHGRDRPQGRFAPPRRRPEGRP